MSAPVTIRALRNFRIKHKISLREIAEEAGTTQQWISLVELGKTPASDRSNYRIARAIQLVIMSRKQALARMEREFNAIKGNLYKEETEWTDP